MQITPASSGLYPVLAPRSREPAAAASRSGAANASSANDVSLARLDGPTNPQDNSDVSRALVSARQRAGLVSLVDAPLADKVRARVGNETVTGGFSGVLLADAGQRAVAAYRDVETQQHRSELTEILGIDVFA